MINLEDYWEDETPGPDREPTNELRNEVEETITLMELLKVSELKDICRSVSFPVSGRKAVLQDLIRNFLQNALVVGKSDPYRVQAVKFLIERIRKNEPLPVYKDLWNALRKGTPLSAITVRSMEGPPTVQQQSPSVIRQSPTQRRKTSTTSSTSRAPPPTNPDASSSSSSFAVPTIHFKESPFYKIQRLIPELVMNVEVTGGRGMCSAKFKLSKADYNLLSNPNSKHRLYLFSGMINPLGSRGNEPIQFPFPNELRCNNVQIKDNIRGFKSKPGTAKPADLTPHLKPYTQQNNVELIYAFTTKEYKLFGYIVEMITPEQLLEKVLQHPKIIKQATLLYLKKTLREDEEMGLTTTSTIMSLQCPISYTRMKYPSKSINCKHLQCFDALWFLHSQLQIPTWQCPVCQIDIALENLAISEFVDDILQNCQKNVEQVELTSDGKWTAILEDDDDSDSDSNDGSRSPEKGTSVSDHHCSSSHPSEPIIINLDSDDDEPNGNNPHVTNNHDDSNRHSNDNNNNSIKNNDSHNKNNNNNNNNNNSNATNSNSAEKQRKIEESSRFADAVLDQYIGSIHSLCKDQHGCRFLQKQLDILGSKAADAIFEETKDYTVELMTDSFGNYLIQKLLEEVTTEQRIVLTKISSPHFVEISLNPHGTRALQKLIECIKTDEEAQIVVDSLRPYTVQLSKDLNGNHVIQKCLQRLKPENFQFIFDAISDSCIDIATHRHGCCVLQRCLDHGTTEQCDNLCDKLLALVDKLTLDPFGNYVVQYIITKEAEKNKYDYTHKIVHLLKPRAIELSIHKFGSNVIEKILKTAIVSEPMILEILNNGGETGIQSLLNDSYGNYVLQTALDISHKQNDYLYRRLSEIVAPLLVGPIRNTPHGKRIIGMLHLDS